MSLERKEATADVLHEQGPRPREERVAQDDREQADGGGSPPPPRGARPEEGQGGEASDGEGQGGSRRQVGRTRPNKERRSEEAPRAHAGPLRGREGGWGRDAPVLLIALIHPSAWKGNSANFALTEFSEVRIHRVLGSQ